MKTRAEVSEQRLQIASMEAILAGPHELLQCTPATWYMKLHTPPKPLKGPRTETPSHTFPLRFATLLRV